MGGEEGLPLQRAHHAPSSPPELEGHGQLLHGTGHTRTSKPRGFAPRVQVVLAVMALGVGGFILFLLLGRSPEVTGTRGLSWLPQISSAISGSSTSSKGALSKSTAVAVRDVCAAGKLRYLVTGAAGFIGYHASLALVSRPDSIVVGIDNFNDYYPVSLKRARAKELLASNVPVVDADINNMDALEHLFRLCNFTHVLHLAAQAGVRYASRNPFSYVTSNVQVGDLHMPRE